MEKLWQECCEKVCRGWFSHVPESSSLVVGCLDADVEAAVLNKNKKWYHKLCNTPTSVYILSILFSIHFPVTWTDSWKQRNLHDRNLLGKCQHQLQKGTTLWNSLWNCIKNITVWSSLNIFENMDQFRTSVCWGMKKLIP